VTQKESDVPEPFETTGRSLFREIMYSEFV